MGQVNILLYYGGPRDEGKEEGGGLETKVATGQKMVKGKKFFMVRKKSENLTSSQGTFESLKEVRKKGNFKSTHLFLSLYFCCSLNIFNSFVHFTDMNHVVLVDCCSLH